MKRAAIAGAVLVLAMWSFAQSNSQNPSTPQNPPAAQPGTAQPGTAQQGTAQPGATPQAEPQGKRPPQTKTQAEFDAYKAAATNTDPAALEKAANDFAAKFPDSEVRIILFKSAMRAYQSANNADKTLELGRKVLAIDPDDPESLVIVASVLAERTRDTDLDKDQRLDEAMKMAQHATQTVDTDVSVPAGTPQDKVDAYKGLLRSNAYSIIGTLEFKKDNFKAAETDLRKSIDAFPAQPDPVVVLRLALALDKQDRYPEALTYATKASELTQENTPAGGLARRECERVAQLAKQPKPPACGAGAPATPAQNQVPPKQ